MLAVFLGLASAFSWGAADFIGGLISRRISAARAAFLCEIVGLLPLLAIAFVSREKIDWNTIGWCVAAGFIGSLGLLILFVSFARGQMSLAAPASALTAACLPVVVGMVTDGFQSPSVLGGFGFAFLAIWLISHFGKTDQATIRWRDLALPLVSGIGFGSYFVFMHIGSQSALYWPLCAARLGGTVALFGVNLGVRERKIPDRSVWPLVILNTVLDIGGSLFYIIAGQIGRMDISAVLASLYSGATVLFAWLILKEKINRQQAVGIGFALLAVILMTI